jgi:hypothetical protein
LRRISLEDASALSRNEAARGDTTAQGREHKGVNIAMSSGNDPDNPKNKDNPSEKGKPSHDDGEPSAPILRAKIDVPQSVIDKFNAEDQAQARREEKKIWLERLTVWGVFIYATIAAVQLWAYQCTSVRELRAYVNVTGIEIQCPSCLIANYQAPEPTPGLVIMDVVQIFVQNGGRSPAYDVTAHVNWQPMAFGYSLPTDFPYPDYNSPLKGNLAFAAGRTTLNPDGNTVFTFRVDVDQVVKARAKQTSLFFYGHVDYPRHLFAQTAKPILLGIHTDPE